MALIPDATNILIGQNVEVESARAQTTRTYKINFDTGRIGGFVDETEAMKQAIIKIIETERFDYLIYSWNYGAELNAALGKSYPVLESEIKRILREALLADSRIDDIYDFKISRADKRAVSIDFTAATMFGEIPVETEVETSV